VPTRAESYTLLRVTSRWVEELRNTRRPSKFAQSAVDVAGDYRHPCSAGQPTEFRSPAPGWPYSVL